ncbi:MAG TPA: TetR/AcrR family transcriptional regulator [Gemmatimonadaceae bacterium]
MVKPAGKRTVARDRDTEQRILDAANAVFIRRGTAGARMQEIAEEAGVNKALLHYYFRNKSRLGEAVFRRVATGMFARLATIMSGDADIEIKVAEVVDVYFSQLSKVPYVPGYVLSELNQHPERSKQLLEIVHSLRSNPDAPDFVGALSKQLARAAREGHIRPIAADQFLVNLVSLCVFPFAARPMICAVLQLDERGYERFMKQRAATLTQFFLDALRP